MGIEEIEIETIYLKQTQLIKEEPILYILGKNFTEWSKVVINGEVMETIFLNTELLAVTELPKEETQTYAISVHQQGNDRITLSQTKVYEIQK